MPATIAITREVSASIADCELTHLDRAPIDVAVARAEHAAYERALVEAGCALARIPADDALPDAVFVEDAAVVLDELAVITRPGAESRRAETAAVAAALRVHRPLAEIVAPGTLDGGDVLRVGRRVWVGVGARTNADGLAQLRSLAAPLGYDVRGESFRGALHLKTAVTAVADDLLLVHPEWVDASAFGGLATIAIDPAEPFAANALLVNGRVLHGAQFERTRLRLVRAGVSVVPVPAAELAKAEGGVTCGCLLVPPTR
jgi:dimethylargininase